jgi:hypothetical protein
MTSVKKITLSIYTSCFVHVKHNLAIKLDLVILTRGVTNKMIEYLISG